MAKRLLSKTFGEVVRARRSEVGLTQEMLAERAGVHPTYIGMVERGERNCSLDVASEIAEALHTLLSKLIEESEAQNSKSVGTSTRKGRSS
jgi:transcriptional regulator with XRE-family HTH domain